MRYGLSRQKTNWKFAIGNPQTAPDSRDLPLVPAGHPVANVAFSLCESPRCLTGSTLRALRQTMRPLVLNPSIPSLALPFCPAHRHAVDLRKYQR